MRFSLDLGYGRVDSTEAWIRGNDLLPKTSKCPNAAARKFYLYYMSKSDNNSKYLLFLMDFGHFFKVALVLFVVCSQGISKMSNN